MICISRLVRFVGDEKKKKNLLFYLLTLLSDDDRPFSSSSRVAMRFWISSLLRIFTASLE
jgi:hypothetical protein